MHSLVWRPAPNLTLRVLPISAGLHPGLDCGNRFVLLEFPRSRARQQEPPVVYSDSLTGAWYGDAPDEVAAYDRAWGGMAAVCLSPDDSLELIRSLQKKRGRQ